MLGDLPAPWLLVSFNDVEGLENPTSEVTAKWLFDRIKAKLPELVAITFHETCDARCIYRGD